jgi:choline-sulfatase
MIRRDHWKYNCYHEQEPELFNLAADPGETRNLAADPASAAVCAALQEQIMRGWDPEFVRRRLADMPQELHLIGEWVRRTHPSEPDPPWFSEPLENWHDTPQPRAR